MNNQTTIEHIMAICENYKQSLSKKTQLLSMLAGGGAPAKGIVEAQDRSIDMFEAEAFVAVTRIKAFLDQDRLMITPTFTPNEETIEQFLEENKE